MRQQERIRGVSKPKITIRIDPILLDFVEKRAAALNVTKGYYLARVIESYKKAYEKKKQGS